MANNWHPRSSNDPAPRPPSPAPSSSTSSSIEEDATIASHGSASAFTATAEKPKETTPAELPAAIGHYRILRKLGEGGMGIVYEAEQQNPRRRVALKVVRGGRFVDENTVRMFRREAETLARLRHPNIAAIYESGRTDEGQHYFAMELVQGESLDAFLARRPKATTQDEVRFRLNLFRRIAEAVHYAHQRGVIHRDLKPSNIILAPDIDSDSGITSLSGVRLPDVKILDFGLARITEGDVQATQVTEVGVIKGTLPYMSPEQARGNVDAIDVRTDVYALGVILYEMLASAKPYDVTRASLVEAVRVICEEPPRSLRTTLSGSRRLDPDIETIIGKALEKDAERRYASALAMSEDLERYLSSQPILARPPSTVYQLRKFAGRNRALVAGVAATFIVLVAGVVVSSYQALRASRAEALATERMARAMAAEGLAKRRQAEAETALSMAEQSRADAETQKAAAQVAQFGAEQSREQAKLEANKATAISRFLEELLATADPWAGGAGKVTLDAALERARLRIGSWAGDDPDVSTAIRGTIASAFAGVGKYAEADSMLRGGIDQLQAQKMPRPDLVAQLHRSLGSLLGQTARYGDAESQYREALALERKSHPSTADTTGLIMSEISGALAHQGRYPEADSIARAAATLVRRDPAAGVHATPAILRTRAYIEANWKENYAGADSLLHQGVSFLAAHPEGRSVEMSDAIEELAANRARMGDLSGADSLYSAAVSLRRRALGDNHPLVARALENQSALLYRSGQLGQSETVLRQVLAIRQQGLGPESELVGRTWVALAPVLAHANKPKESEAAFTTGITILKKRLGEQHPVLATAYGDFADLRMRQRRFDAAEKLERDALKIRLQSFDATSAGTVDTRIGLANAILSKRSNWLFPEAEQQLLAAREAASDARGPGDPGALRATQTLVQLYDAWHKPAESAKWRAALPAGLASGGSGSVR